MNKARIYDWARDQFELTRNNSSNIRSMEGLRGLAVLLVFFTHYVTQVEPWMSTGSATWYFADELRGLGHMGVDLFFVLSGYLIYGALIRRHQPFVGFIVRRAVRIYPTFLFMFGLYLILSFVFPQESKLPAGWTDTLIYLTQNILFLPGMFEIEPLIVVAWSLSYEFFYYLAMPLFIAVLALRKWTPAARLWLFAAIGVGGFAYYYFFYGHIQLLMFVGGILVYEIRAEKRFAPSNWSGMVVFAVAIVALIVIRHVHLAGWFRYATLCGCLSWLCLECFAVKGGAERLFSFTPLRWLGNISYSYYLIHGLTLQAFFLVFAKVHAPAGGEDMLFWLLLPVVFGATLLVSAALFVCIEKPMSLVKPPSTPAAEPVSGKTSGLPDPGATEHNRLSVSPSTVPTSAA